MTGHASDGKFAVTNLERVVRTRTSETDQEAVAAVTAHPKSR